LVSSRNTLKKAAEIEVSVEEINIVIAGDNPAIQKIEALAREIWLEYYPSIISIEQIFYMLFKFQTVEAIKQQIEDGYMYYLILDRKAFELGYLAFQPREEELFLSKIYIKKEFRGQGLGKQALEFVAHVAKQNKLGKITLTVNKNNKNSIAAYLKSGFIKKEEVVSDIGGGFVMDDYVLEKKVEI